MVDSIRGVKIVEGQDIEQNLDMSRQEYIDKMSPEEKKTARGIEEEECRGPEGQCPHQSAQCRSEDDRPGQEGHRQRCRGRDPGSGRQRFQDRYCRQDERDQDRQVHRHREPDDQGTAASSRTRPCCGAKWATGSLGSSSRTTRPRPTRRPSISRPLPKSRACLRHWSGAGRPGRDLRAHRQGSRGQCRL